MALDHLQKKSLLIHSYFLTAEGETKDIPYEVL